MYKKRRRSSWPSRLLAVGLLLGGSCWITTPAFADDCGDPGSPVGVTIPLDNKSCAIETGSDEDWFTFTAQAGHSYTIKADQVGADIDIALELRSPETTVKASQNRGFEGEPETLNEYKAEVAGSFWIRVFHTGYFGSNTAYQLTVTEAPKPQATKIDVDKTSIPDAKASQLYQLTFKVLDNKDQVMQSAGQKIQLTLTDSGGTPVTGIFFGSDNPVAIDDGQKAVNFTAPATAGNYQIKAVLVGNDQVTLTSPIAVTVESGDLVSLTLTPNTDCQSPHSADAPCTLKVEGKDGKDGGGNTVSIDGQQITLNLTAVDKNNQPISITDPKKVVTVTNGVTEDLQLKTAGSYTIKATSPVESAEVPVTVVADAPAKLKLTENGNGCQPSPQVGTPCTMIFELMDTHENKIDPAGKNVSFTVTPSDTNSKVKDCVVSFESGQVKCTLTPDKAGSYTIASATVDNTAILFAPTLLPVVQVQAASSKFVLAPKEGTMPPATVGTAYKVTFILKDNDTLKGGEMVHFEMTKPQDSQSLLDATDKPTDATTGEVSVSFTPDIAGQYVIKASLVSDSTVTGSATVTAKAVEPSTPTLSITQDCPSLSVGTDCGFTFKLTTLTAGTVNVSWTKTDDNTFGSFSDVSIQNEKGNAQLKFDSEGSYTITAVLATDSAVTNSTSVTVSPATPPPPQTTYSLTVVGGGNQSVVQGQLSQPILLTMMDEKGTPQSGQEVTFTLTNPLDSDDKVSLTSYDEQGNKVVEDGTVTGKTDSQGKVKVEVSFEKKTGMTGVTTYLLSAKLKDNPGVADYTNVFLLEKPLEELLKTTPTTWPILQVVKDEEGTLETNGTGTGSATDKGGQDLPGGTTAIFHGGLNGQQQAKVGLTDTVTVQGVIEIDSTHLGQVADIVVFGANDSPKGWDKTHPDDEIKADGCYMLDSSFPVNILSLGSDKACQLGKDEVSKPVPFRRGVTLAKEMLVEMYTGKFVYPATPLKIYFGYRLTDGTLVYNGSNPIYITIEEK